MVRAFAVLGQGLNQFHPHSQARRVEAWKSVLRKHRSTERPQIQTLLTQLAELKMATGEKVTDYLTRLDDRQEAGEMTSNAIFSAMVVKGLPPTFESIATVLNFGPRKGYEEMKQDLMNLANTRPEPCTDMGSTAFQLKRGQHQQQEDHVLQVPKGGKQGERLQIKGKQRVLKVQYEKLSCKRLQEQKVSVQWYQQGSRKARRLELRKLRRGFKGRSTRAICGFGLQRVHAEDRVSLQRPRRGSQHQFGPCQRESNTSGR